MPAGLDNPDPLVKVWITCQGWLKVDAWKSFAQSLQERHNERKRHPESEGSMIDALQHILEQVEQLDPALQETLAKRFQQVIQEELKGQASEKNK